MKRLLFALMLLPAVVFGQEDRPIGYIGDETEFSPQDTANHSKNVIYWSINPAQRSLLGVRYEHYFEMSGIYASVAKLKFTGGDDVLNTQIRYAAGWVCRLSYRRDEIDSPILTVGAVYHHWLTKDYVEGQVNPDKAFRELSIEFGLGGRIKRFNIAARVDSQFEFCVDLGYNF